MSVEIAAIGVQRPFVLEALEQEFVVHKVWEAAGSGGGAAAGGGQCARRRDSQCHVGAVGGHDRGAAKSRLISRADVKLKFGPISGFSPM
jgi:hypothetical protein